MLPTSEIESALFQIQYFLKQIQNSEINPKLKRCQNVVTVVQRQRDVEIQGALPHILLLVQIYWVQSSVKPSNVVTVMQQYKRQ